MTNNNDNPRSKKNSENEEFPGYPHYPSSEDIMNPKNEIERVSIDVENLTPTDKLATPRQQPASAVTDQNAILSSTGEEDDLRIVEGTEADVTREDLNILDAADGAFSASRAGVELDIPWSELDDANEEIGEEDEENNYYSLGGDNHEDLEKDPTID